MIYFLEDDDSIRKLVIYGLESQGFEAEGFSLPSAFWRAMEQKAAELVLLDIMLPALNGMEVLRRLRKESNVPVIMLTARDTVMDKVSGLDSGADDYITKPFAIEELLARIRAALRNKAEANAKAAEEASQIYSIGELVMDCDRHEVTVGGTPVELTRREFDLLRYLLEHKEKVVSRESLLDNVWGFDFVGETNTVDVYIRFLRSKIDEPFGKKWIHTVRGVGYVIRED